MIKKLLIIISSIFIFLIIPFSSAYFTVDIDQYPKWSYDNLYEGQKNTLSSSFKITKDNWENSYCVYDCSVQVNGVPANKEFIGSNANEPYNFIVDGIEMRGTNGKFIGTLSVKCDRKGSGSISSMTVCAKAHFEGSDIYNPNKSVTVNFRHSNDGECDVPFGEKCNTAENDCSCKKRGTYFSCLPNNPLVDDWGCTTCGNNQKNNGETCNNCPEDIGKCDGSYCKGASECENKNCVRNECLNAPYKLGDTFCDLFAGESCINSEKDCACKNNMQCNRQTAQCETYCGNGICEQEEAGKCKVDCQWCGDGVCNANENCKMCDFDCGKCKEEEKQSLVGSFLSDDTNKQQNTEIEKTNNEVKDVQASGITGNVVSDEPSDKGNSIKMIILVAIILLTLLVLIYGGRKILKNNRKRETNTSENFDKDKRLQELKERIKNHKKELKELKK